MKEILLFEKKILVDKSEVLLQYMPDEDWRDIWCAGFTGKKENNGMIRSFKGGWRKYG